MLGKGKRVPKANSACNKKKVKIHNTPSLSKGTVMGQSRRKESENMYTGNPIKPYIGHLI